MGPRLLLQNLLQKLLKTKIRIIISEITEDATLVLSLWLYVA